MLYFKNYKMLDIGDRRNEAGIDIEHWETDFVEYNSYYEHY